MLATLLLLALGRPAPTVEGRPLFYWGARPPVIEVEAPAGEPSAEALVLEVHAVLDRGDLVLRFTFDRPVREAVTSPEGAPVSGRLRAVVYLDVDDNRRTGYDGGGEDLATGADQRFELGVVAVGEDVAERQQARALIAVNLATVGPDGRRRTLWRADDGAEPGRVSRRGEWVEVRMPADLTGAHVGSRLVLVQGSRAVAGRLR